MRAWWALAIVGVGCGGASAPDAGADGAVDCATAANGTSCGLGLVCEDGACVTAAGCGNAIVDPGEECDDGNDVAFDGCEADCTRTCDADTECDDADLCNGAETCSTSTGCVAGTDAPDGTSCDRVAAGTCRIGRCALPTCGDGDVDAGEECDDANETPDDGCESDCRFSCVGGGAEVCDGADDDCDGRIDEGVSFRCFADGDGDLFAPVGAAMTFTCTPCASGTTERQPVGSDADCDDAEPTRHPGAAEVCDRLDSDCSVTSVDDLSEDEDDDGHAPVGAPCNGGLPRDDCFDTNAEVHPDQTGFFPTDRGDGSFDYDCNGSAELRTPAIGGCTGLACTFTRGWCGSIPACGISGFLLSCRVGAGMCMVDCTTEATQECR